MRCLRTRHLTRRIVGPVAIQTDDTPLDAPVHPDHARVLADRIIHGVLVSVRDSGDGGAEAARDRVRSPRSECDFPYPLKPDDLQIGIPEAAFLFSKTIGDGIEAGLAGGQYAIVSRADQINALFQPARGSR